MSDRDVIETGESPSNEVIQSSGEENPYGSNEEIEIEEEISENQIEEVEEDEDEEGEEALEEEEEVEEEEEESEENIMNKPMIKKIPKPFQPTTKEDKSNEDLLKNKVELHSLTTNTMLNLIGEFQKVKEELYLVKEQYKKEKEAAEISLTDKDDEIAVLQRKIQKLESNNLELRQKLIHSENQKKLFESKYQEAISNSEKSNINIAIEKSDNVAHEAEINRLQIENDLLKSKVEELQRKNTQLQSELNNLNSQIQTLQEKNSASKDIIQGNENSMRNIGFFDFKSQMDKIAQEYNALKIISEGVNLDQQSIVAFSELMLKKFHQLEEKLYYYQENQIEEKLSKQIQENQIMTVELGNAEYAKNALIEENKKLELENGSLKERNAELEKLEKAFSENSNERSRYEDLIATKDKIIKELENLISIYEAQLYESRIQREASDEIEEEVSPKESREDILNRYNKLKKEWVELMKNHKTLKTLLDEYKAKDQANQEKYEDSFIKFVLEEIRQLKEKNKKLEEEYNFCFNQAKEKIAHIKNVCKEVLGWEINEKANIIELKSTFMENSDDAFVFERTAEGKYNLLETQNQVKMVLDEHKALFELLEVSVPLFLAYFTVFMKPEVKEVFLVL